MQGVSLYSSGLTAFCAVTLLTICIHGALIHFPSVDEVAHLPAGVSHWRFESFDLYRVNPPLVRMVAAIPSYVTGADFDWSDYSSAVGRRPEFDIGVHKLKDSKLALHSDYLMPRLFCCVISFIGLLVLTKWSAKTLSGTSWCVVCIFFTFSPDILAHSQTIVPDVSAMTCGVCASLMFWRFSVMPKLTCALVAGLCLGVALLTKHTWITGIATFPFTLCLLVVLRFADYESQQFALYGCKLVASITIAVVVLNAGYLFKGSGTELRNYEFLSEALGGPIHNGFGNKNRFRTSNLGQVPVPLPKDYVLGIDYLKYEVEQKKWSFLLGEWRYGSWWYYYIVTTLVKTPLATLIGAVMGLAYVIHRWRKGTLPLEVKTMLICIAVPAITCFASVSYQGGFNHHHRYVMMINPLMFVLVAALALPDNGRISRLRIGLVSSLTIGMLWATFSVAPHYLSFFNSLAGGPSNGWKVLGFSNIDWGARSVVREQVDQSSPRMPTAGVRIGLLGDERRTV